MDSKEITLAVGCKLFEAGHTPICANFQTMALHECDIISVNSNGFLSEFEIKVSVSDFKADFKKKAKHQTLQHGPFAKVTKNGELTHYACSYFYYVCPACLIREDMVPAYAGLIWVHANGRVDTKIQAPLLHKYKADAKLIKKIAHNLTQKHLFGASHRTFVENENKKPIEPPKPVTIPITVTIPPPPVAPPVAPPKLIPKPEPEPEKGKRQLVPRSKSKSRRR